MGKEGPDMSEAERGGGRQRGSDMKKKKKKQESDKIEGALNEGGRGVC